MRKIKTLTLLAVSIAVMPTAGAREDQILGDQTPLRNVGANSRIEITRPFKISYPKKDEDGRIIVAEVSSVASVSSVSQCTVNPLPEGNSAVPPRPPYEPALELEPGDYFETQQRPDTEFIRLSSSISEIHYTVTLHSKNAHIVHRYVIGCRRKTLFDSNYHDLMNSNVADLRRALGWNVWIRGTAYSDANSPTSDASVSTSPAGAPPPPIDGDTRASMPAAAGAATTH